MFYFDLTDWEKYSSLCNVDYTTVITVSSNKERNAIVYLEKETLTEASLTIGKFCSIAAGVTFYLGGNHNHKRVTTRLPFRFKKDENSKNMLTKGNINIQNDVWIGDGATIMSGVTIGTGSIIGAKALVASDIEPYSIAVGNPARTIKKRFDEETVSKMLKYQWWNLKDSVIMENSEKIFSEDLERFFEMCDLFYQNKDEYYKKFD